MIKKKKLGDLIKQEIQRTEPERGPTELEPEETLPKYLSLVRKKTRLKELQIERLTTITRKLNRQCRGRGERITENT